MLLRLPRGLHYPITITKVLKQAGFTVTTHEAIFLYSYETTVREGSRDGQDKYVKKSFPATFESGLEGKLKFWKIAEGDVLVQPVEVAEIEEECPHSEQYAEMCTNCGKDMTIISSYNIDASDTDRAPLHTAHNTKRLKISPREAARREEETKRRLLASRKLSLVVDLDQTVIHAAVDPTIAEWQRDPDNPNYEAVKDVRYFQLIDDTPGMRGCWYYIKLRPNLAHFLEQISHTYELHIYTMGTRQYAEQVANIVDPDRKYFGDRILSRDESGSATNKNLERLFPIDTKMVVIIDDRGDVWKWNANLIRVMPFDFFVGIGDINSSFLPRKPDINSLPSTSEIQENPQPPLTEKDVHGSSEVIEKAQKTGEDGATATIEGTDTSALEQLVAMGGVDDPAVREIQSKGQEETIAAQLEEKPLLQMQKLLDAKDQVAAAEEEEEQEEVKEEGMAKKSEGDEVDRKDSNLINGDRPDSTVESESSSPPTEATDPTPSPAPKATPIRHSLLRDDDRELLSLATRLTAVHSAFYSEYDRRRLGHKGGRVAALSGKRKIQLQTDLTMSPEEASDLLLVPDVKSVMPAMKNRVLSGVVVVFSGVLPLHSNVQTADIGLWAKTFGAVIAEKVDKGVTHVVAARPGTTKVKQAVKKGLWIVGMQWLIGCMTGWKRLKEDEYVLPDLPGAQNHKTSNGSPERSEGVNERQELLDDTREFLLSSSDEAEDDVTSGADADTKTEDNKARQPERNTVGPSPDRKRLKIDIDDQSRRNEDENVPRIGDGANGFMEDVSALSLDQTDWEDMDKELREFMGSSDIDSISDDDDDDDDDNNDLGSTSSKMSLRGRHTNHKRKRQPDDDGQESDAATGRQDLTAGSRIRHSLSTLKQTNVGTVSAGADARETDEANESRIRNEQQAAEDAEKEDGAAAVEATASELSSDDELARELEREFETRSDDEDEDEDENADGWDQVEHISDKSKHATDADGSRGVRPPDNNEAGFLGQPEKGGAGGTEQQQQQQQQQI